MTTRKRQIRAAVYTLALAVFLIASLAGAVTAKDTYDWIVAKRLTVTNAADLQSTLSVGSAATFDTTTATTGAAAFASTIDVDGAATLASVTVEGDLAVTSQAVIVVTMGGYITPTGIYQPITSTGTVGTANLAAGADGDLLVLINESNTTITISDTGTLILSGDAALGQYDNLTLISDGTNWIEIGETNN